MIVPAILVFCVFISGQFIATQMVAAGLEYHRALGQPLFLIGNTPVYLPLYILWYWHYAANFPDLFDRAGNAVYISAVLSVVIMVAMVVLRAQKKKVATSHGSARWADKNDIEASGLLGKKNKNDVWENSGVFLGKTDDGQYLRHDGPEHILTTAPTRSGKGVGNIIPTLLEWPHSTLVTDIKGENWKKTSGFRQTYLNNKVLKFEPTDGSGASARYNPLNEVRLMTDDEVRDVQNIADMVVDPQGTGQLDHWAKTGHALLVGVILHLLYIKPGHIATLTDIASFLSDPNKDSEETLSSMIYTEHVTDPAIFQRIYGRNTNTHPVVAEAARELLNKSENERSGVISTAMSFLGLYRDPVIARNTAVSDFCIKDLMNYSQPVSLYLVIAPSDINRLKPLMRLVINQIISGLMEDMKYQHRLLMLLDEFPALGRLEKFEASLAVCAGYGIKCWVITQSLTQLYKAYTDKNGIIGNCHVRLFHTPNEPIDGDFISKLLGDKTEVIQNSNYSGGRFKMMLSNESTTTTESARRLLTTSEVMQVPADREIIFVGALPPIYAKKIRYYSDANFNTREIAYPKTSDILREQPPIPIEAIISPVVAAAVAVKEPVTDNFDPSTIQELVDSAKQDLPELSEDGLTEEDAAEMYSGNA